MLAVDASERLWQDKVVQLARICGWHVDHTPTMRDGSGHWATGGLKGKPDLWLLRDGEPAEVIYAELKTEKGRLSPEQKQVLSLLHRAGLEVHVWRPSDFDLIRERLQPKRKT